MTQETFNSFTQNDEYKTITGAQEGFSTLVDDGLVNTLQFPLWLGTDRVNDYSQMHYMVIYINEVATGPRYQGLKEGDDEWKSRISEDSPISWTSDSNLIDPKVQHAKEAIGNAVNQFTKGASEYIDETTNSIKDGLQSTYQKYTPSILQSAVKSAAPVTNKIVDTATSLTPTAGIQAAGEFVMKSVGETLGKVLPAIIEKIGPRIVKLKKIVALPIPDQLNVTHSANWQEAQPGAGGIADLINMADSMAGQNSIPNAVKTFANQMMYNGAIGIMNSFGNTGNAITKTTLNERKEGVYMGHERRGFSFTWTLYPENDKESKALWDIIQTLKYYSLPEEDKDDLGNGRWLIQPAMFEIEFWSNNQRNDWIPRTLTCSLDTIDINYTPTGKFATFEPSQGQISGAAPVGVSLTLQFREVETLTKERILGENKDFRLSDQSSTGGLL